jgi:hypothetical protein
MAASVAAALRQFGAAYLAQHSLSTPQAKAWRGIVACHTAALGGDRLACDACGHSQWHYHSCRNRHCPQCGTRAKDAWLQARLAQVLDVPYAHMVFTLPHSLNALYANHPRWVIDTLFACVAQTLTEFAANPRWLGGQPAFTLVLHTWGQELQRHIHVHAVIACGGLAAGDDSSTGQWVQPTRSPEFLFPVTALSTVFRGKFMAALQAAHEQGGIANDPQRATLDWAKRHHALYRFDWVVYAKTPLGGPAQVLKYLARYTHRTAISNERIVKIGADQVVFKVRADDKGGKRLVKFDGVEFVRRFLLHVLPTGLKRIRHYGLLAPSKGDSLAQARAQMQMPQSNPVARESAQDFLRRVAQVDLHQCPCCKLGRLRLVETLKGCKTLALPGAQTAIAPPSTGPP